MQEAGTLLKDLFTGKQDTDRILIWQLKGKRSRWIEDPADALSGPIDGDTYFGTGTVTADDALKLGQFKRSRSAIISGIGALWLDVDIAGPAHKKDNLPETITAARLLIEATFQSWPPTHIVHSGHGLQIYWALDVWWKLDTQIERSRAASLEIDLNALWIAACKDAGYAADSVCDLARVMRLPGTTNHKDPAKPMPITVVETTGKSYTKTALRALINSHTKSPAARASNTPPTVAVEPTAAKTTTQTRYQNIDPDKWEALCALDRRVQPSWDHKRPDLADQTPSTYDMSLAAFAVRAGWSDAEVINLMTQCRIKHGCEIKPHALQLTLNKAKAEVAALNQSASITETPEQIEPDAGAATPPADIARLSKGLNTPIAAIIRYDSTPPAYLLVLDNEERIPLGPIDGLTDQKKFRNSVAAHTGKLPTRQKPDHWDNAVNLMLSLVTNDSAGPEATEAGQTTEQILAYLRAVTVHKDRSDLENREDGLTAGEPWTEAGTVHITGTPFRTWLSVNLSDRLTTRALGLALRSIGCEPCTVAAKTSDTQTTTRAAWKLPERFSK